MENTLENKRLFKLYSAAALTGLTSSTAQGMPMSAIAAAYAIDMIEQYNALFPAPVFSSEETRVPANIVDHMNLGAHPYEHSIPPRMYDATAKARTAEVAEQKYGSATGHGGTEEQAPVVKLIKDLQINVACFTAEQREQVIGRCVFAGLYRPTIHGDFLSYPIVNLQAGSYATYAGGTIPLGFPTISATDFLKTYTK